MPDDRPIAIFDTGPGVMAFVEELRARTAESTVVFLDVLHHPIGAQYPEKVRSLAVSALLLLQNTDAKLGIVASTSAAALAMSGIQESVAMPVVGAVVPAVTAAVQATETGRIAVLAGVRDAKCSYDFVRRLNEMEPTIGVLHQTSSELDLLLDGTLDQVEARARIRAILGPADRLGADVILFSSPEHCRLSRLIHQEFPSRFNVVDIPAVVCSRVLDVLRQNRMLGSQVGTGAVRILSTAKLGHEFEAAALRGSISISDVDVVTLPVRSNLVPTGRGHVMPEPADLAHTAATGELPMLPGVNPKEAVHVLDS